MLAPSRLGKGSELRACGHTGGPRLSELGVGTSWVEGLQEQRGIETEAVRMGMEAE